MDADDPRAELRETLARFDEALNARDPLAIGAFFAEDATFVDAFGAFARGRATIGRAIAGVLDAQLLPQGRVRFELVGARLLGGGFAFVDLAQHVDGIRRPDGGAGRVTLAAPALLAREDGEGFRFLDLRPHYRAARPAG